MFSYHIMQLYFVLYDHLGPYVPHHPHPHPSIPLHLSQHPPSIALLFEREKNNIYINNEELGRRDKLSYFLEVVFRRETWLKIICELTKGDKKGD